MIVNVLAAIAGGIIGIPLAYGLFYVIEPVLDRIQGYPFGYPESGDWIDHMQEKLSR